ncbi:hypothetical protein MRS44_003868 [Fusarium solani]|uniref:uncharacterized protein n=1 Tax=Fusarium solani TaxID=169388 RepID=UPI0032C3D7BC|nr:hypothetical protein MRS44_003868 [Fusarium solani]
MDALSVLLKILLCFESHRRTIMTWIWPVVMEGFQLSHKIRVPRPSILLRRCLRSITWNIRFEPAWLGGVTDQLLREYRYRVEQIDVFPLCIQRFQWFSCCLSLKENCGDREAAEATSFLVGRQAGTCAKPSQGPPAIDWGVGAGWSAQPEIHAPFKITVCARTAHTPIPLRRCWFTTPLRMTRHQEWKCSPLRSKAKNGIHKSARAARANNACQTPAHASPIRTRDAMATPMPSPNILPQLEARQFKYSFQWGGGSCTGHAMLVLNNHRILSYLLKNQHHHRILNYLETTRFKDFRTDHSKIQRHVLKFDGWDPGCLLVQFFPEDVQLTAEFRDAPEEVVWNDDSPNGSATDATNLRETPDSYIDPSSETPPTSAPRSVASSAEEVKFRSQATPAASTSDDPHYGEVESIRGYRWTVREINLATDIVKGNKPFRLIDFPGRPIGGIQYRLQKIRKSLRTNELPPDPVHLIGFSRSVAVAVAARFRLSKSVDEIIKALPNASEQEIRDEYLHLKYVF